MVKNFLKLFCLMGFTCTPLTSYAEDSKEPQLQVTGEAVLMKPADQLSLVVSVVTQASFYGSILPATWSLMLALRARGLGASWTTLHLMFEREVGEILGIPETVTQAALLPVAYFTGEDFRPASRIPAREITYWDDWGVLR